MSRWDSPDAGSERGRVATAQPNIWRNTGWALLQVLALVALGYAGWRVIGDTTYRIDIDIYRMGGQAWLDGHPLYSPDVKFHTPIGLNLPFTYPPLAAVIFAPFAWLGMTAASVAITIITLALLLVSTMIVLTRMDVWEHTRFVPGPAWLRRWWLTVLVVTWATLYWEPIQANFAFGQINVVLMTLVIADCVPRRTPWPRGVLLGLGVAIKMTPAVFLLYFLLRRDRRAVITTLASVAAATLAGFVLAWQDSWEYWTDTVRDTSRIGSASLNTNQNIAGTLARLGLDDHHRFLPWVAGCFVVLALTVWAARRVLRAEEPTLAVICIALFGLMTSPVSWSHHWVWMLPTVVVTAVLAWRRRNIAMAAVSAAGVALMVWTPIDLMPKHHEVTAPLWRQLVGASYLWWALATLLAAGATVTARAAAAPAPQPSTAPAPVSAVS
jgi:alpha-1,2-mannosyltransferase